MFDALGMETLAVPHEEVESVAVLPGTDGTRKRRPTFPENYADELEMKIAEELLKQMNVVMETNAILLATNAELVKQLNKPVVVEEAVAEPPKKELTPEEIRKKQEFAERMRAGKEAKERAEAERKKAFLKQMAKGKKKAAKNR